MIRYDKYFWYVVKHKWFVFVESGKLGVPWLGTIHDLSKFGKFEFGPYARHFYSPGYDRPENGYIRANDTGDVEFNKAWEHHWRCNPHHWEWWIWISDRTIASPMPDKYRREMLADWIGAGKAQGYGDNTMWWFMKNYRTMTLHDETFLWLVNQIWKDRPDDYVRGV